MVGPGTASQRINHLLVQLLSDLDNTGQFDGQATWLETLVQWFGSDVSALQTATKGEVTAWIQETLATIDELLEQQLQEILHDSVLQKLESSWRGLAYLVGSVDQYRRVEVRALDVSWKELARDAESTIVFDQTCIFKHVYEAEFGSPGGYPFGLLVGDFEISHLPQASVDTPSLVRQLAGTAAAAFAPLILGTSCQIFGADDLPSLERGIDLQRTFAQKEYLAWRSWCAAPDARFLGLALPRFLIRAPYTRTTTPESDFLFTERCSKRSDYLWCNAAFAVAVVIARSFGETGWFDDCLGPSEDDEHRGVLSNLPALTHQSDLDWPIPPIEWTVPDSTAQELTEFGFICLRHCKYTTDLMLPSAPNITAMENVQLSAQTQAEPLGLQMHHVLAVSRFAHYIKCILRDLVGSALSEANIQRRVHTWLASHICANPAPSPKERQKQPLRGGRVEITSSERQPGTYLCRMHLQPHGVTQRLAMNFQLKSSDSSPALPGS